MKIKEEILIVFLIISIALSFMSVVFFDEINVIYSCKLLALFSVLMCFISLFIVWTMKKELIQNRLDIKEKVKRLEQSNKDLEQFAYIASHDLQEPLRMVASFTQLLERRCGDQIDDKAKEYIYYAVNGAQRMQGLIDGLLKYSRLGAKSFKREVVDLNELLEEISMDLKVLKDEKNAVLNIGQMPKVFVNRTQIKQLFQNLIANGIKFQTKDAKPEVNVSCERKNQAITFKVQDNGIGIEEQYYNQIFDIFHRLNLKEDYPGAGVGLALCKKIVENYDGEIYLESKKGLGTTFIFSFPEKEVL